MGKIKVGIIGPGNIGSDLMYKIKRSENLELAAVAGIVWSEGMQRAADMGAKTTIDGIDLLLDDPEIKIIFDATSATAHAKVAPLIKKAGKIAIDLTPAAVGEYAVPVVNLDHLEDADNFNMITCGGQATVPIAYAINRVANSKYTEIVSSISSKSAGPGTRANIDEFTETTAHALHTIGGADKSKAIIVLNPAEPPIMMTNTIYSTVENPDKEKIEESVFEIVKQLQEYVPGYKLRVPPIVEGNKVTVIIQVEGAGDFLPKYSGNLDIINCAAIAIAERVARKMLQ